MTDQSALIDKLVTTVTSRLVGAYDELTTLDQAVGDGDHSINMKRGWEAVSGDLASIRQQAMPQALSAIGTKLVMTVGGASGALYGTLFMTLGKSLAPAATLADASTAFAAAVEAVKARGKSDVGQKTMIDVLVPVRDALAAAVVAGETPQAAAARIRAAADAGAKSTIDMPAIRGRASFLGERSIGHMDAGARSTQLTVEAVLDVLEGKV
jgi:phosphoenolpyruvate---glycerone phosphotransferase subunit DhaL